MRTGLRRFCAAALGLLLMRSTEPLAQDLPKCGTHVGFFDDVTTATLGDRVIYRIGHGTWRDVPVKVVGAHSIARTPSGAWLINDAGADQMIQLDNLESGGRIITRSELGGFALSRPHDQVVDAQTGYIYMVEGRRLFRFRDLEGPVDVWTFAPDTVGYVRGMSWFDGRLHLADATRGEVHRIEDFDRRLMTTFRSPSPPPPAAGPVATRWMGGGSLGATGLVVIDVEKLGDWYYGTNFFAPAFAQGGDPKPGRIIRWRSWKDFERGQWQDLTDLLPRTDDPILSYFMTVSEDSLIFTVLSATPTRTPPSYECFIRLDRQALDARRQSTSR